MGKRKLHPEEIKAQLRIKYKSMTAFEKVMGLKPGSVNDALRGRPTSRTVAAIAESLGKSVSVIRQPKKVGQKGTSNVSISENLDSHVENMAVE